MSNGNTVWLTVANIVLAVAVVAAAVGIATGAICELVARLKHRHSVYSELDRDMHDLFRDSQSKK